MVLKHTNSLFLHCMDSHVDNDSSWYSRFHMGPFWVNTSLQIGTRLRRTLINDVKQISIVAIELNGARHEFCRLSGIHASVFNLLFQFRKIILYSPKWKEANVAVIPFIFFGPGTFFAKDIFWPNDIQCRNPDIVLMTLSTGAIVKGRILIQKNDALGFIPKIGEPLSLDTPWLCKKNAVYINCKSTYPWLSLGFPRNPVKRVGFRIEAIPSLHPQNEILVFEIVTNGRLSPRQAFLEASKCLVEKFSHIVYILISTKHNNCRQSFSYRKYTDNLFQNLQVRERIFSEIIGIRLTCWEEPLRLDLGNLDLTRDRYKELHSFGIHTLGQLIERLAFQSNLISSRVKKKDNLH